jgi:hypothetical protein
LSCKLRKLEVQYLLVCSHEAKGSSQRRLFLHFHPWL